MRKDIALLVGLLIASNAAWAWFAFGQPRADTQTEPPPQDEGQVLRGRVRELEAERARPALVGAERRAAVTPEPQRVEGAAAPDPAVQAAMAHERADAERLRGEAARFRQHEVAVEAQAQAWQRDALQVADGRKRADALRAIEDALLSKDPVLVSAGLRSMAPLRPLGPELARLRSPVVARLADEDAKLRGNAAGALTHLPREDGDLERLLARLDVATTDLQALLQGALALNDGRAEGAVGDAFVRFLVGTDEHRAPGIANLLRGRWVSEEVEDAVLVAWKRRPDDRLWPYVLGQMRPAREARLRTIVAWLPEPALVPDVMLLEPALTKHVDTPLRPLAASLALEALPRGMPPGARAVLLEMVKVNGTAEHAAAVREFAENPMVPEDHRALAKKIAEHLAQKKS